MEIEIYFNDLTPEKQREFYLELGDNGNYDVIPIATIHVGDYAIIEYKTEERWIFDTEEEARAVFADFEKRNLPGIWQLYAFHQLIDEFCGGNLKPPKEKKVIAPIAQ